MNKIVREHYPVANLPEDLRKEFDGAKTVTVTIQGDEELTGLAAVEAAESRYERHLLELAAKPRPPFGSHRGTTTIEEAVARIRALRDEWDD